MPATVPLVLLPGMNCSKRLWTATLEAARHTLPETDTEHARLRGASLDDCVDDLLATLPDQFGLAGLSLGGIVAMAIARRAPERVERLCLLSVNARAPVQAQHAAWAAQRRELANGRTARDLQRELLPVLLSDEARSPETDEQVLAMADDVGAAALDEQLALQSTRVDERPMLADVRVPTVVVAGDRDRLCGLDRHEEIRACVSGARLVVLPGVGHLSPIEAPDAVAEAIAGWWQR